MGGCGACGRHGCTASVCWARVSGPRRGGGEGDCRGGCLIAHGFAGATWVVDDDGGAGVDFCDGAGGGMTGSVKR
jgi:hypothetical protein